MNQLTLIPRQQLLTALHFSVCTAPKNLNCVVWLMKLWAQGFEMHTLAINFNEEELYPLWPFETFAISARHPYAIIQEMAIFKYPPSDISDPQITSVWRRCFCVIWRIPCKCRARGQPEWGPYWGSVCPGRYSGRYVGFSRSSGFSGHRRVPQQPGSCRKRSGFSWKGFSRHGNSCGTTEGEP
jgi:hypothetical protein